MVFDLGYVHAGYHVKVLPSQLKGDLILGVKAWENFKDA